MRDEPINKIPTKLPEEEEGFSLMKVDKSKHEEDGYDVRVIRKPK